MPVHHQADLRLRKQPELRFWGLRRDPSTIDDSQAIPSIVSQEIPSPYKAFEALQWATERTSLPTTQPIQSIS